MKTQITLALGAAFALGLSACATEATTDAAALDATATGADRL